MNDFRVAKREPFNILSMRGGRYYVHSNNLMTFYQLYTKEFNSGKELFFTEFDSLPRAFLDIEGLSDGMKEVKGVVKQFKKLLAKHFVFARGSMDIQPSRIITRVLFNSKYPSKCHVHFFYKDGWGNHRGIAILREWLKKCFELLGNPVDKNAISLRMIGSSKKGGKQLGLYIPKKGGITLENLDLYRIRHKKDDFIIRLKDEKDSLFYKPPYIPRSPSGSTNSVSKNKVHIPKGFDPIDLLDAFPIEAIDDWYTWNRVLFFCEVLGVDRDLVEGWAAGSDKYIECETMQAMEKIPEQTKEKYKNGAFGALINTLKQYLTPEAYREWRGIHLAEADFDMYDPTEPYSIGQFKRKIKEHRRFNDLETAIKTLTEGLSKCCRLIDNGSPKIVYKDDTNPFVIAKWTEFKKDNKNHCIYEYEGESRKLWIFTPLENDKRLSYTDYGFFPNPEERPEFAFNTWPGFKYEKIDRKSNLDKLSEATEKLLKHIFEVWADSNEEKYSYILDWFSFILQNPGKKTKVALVLASAQGAGKGFIIDFFFDEVFGTEICEQVVSLSRLTGHFNSDLENKVLLWIDEIGVEKNNFHVSWERMKSYITDPRIKIEKKRIDQVQKPNYLNLILTTNNLSNLKVEPGDRRYSIFKCNDRYAKDTEYWESFHNIFRDSTVQKTVACEIANFLKYRGGVPIQNIRHFITEEHKNIIEESKPSYQIFIEQLRSGELKGHLGENYKENGEYKASDLFEYFRGWCFDNNFKQFMNAWTFGRKIKDFGVESKKTRKCRIYII